MIWLNGNNTITIINKLSAKDNSQKTDLWYPTVIKNCVWKNDVSRNTTGETSTLSQYTIVRIPYNDKYKPYAEWVKDINNSFTINIGDFIILGELNEPITNILNIIEKYRPNNAIQISSFSDNSNVEFLKHYKVVGV